MRHGLSDSAALSIRPHSRSRRASAAPRSSASSTALARQRADRDRHRQVAEGRCRDRARGPAGARSPDGRRSPHWRSGSRRHRRRRRSRRARSPQSAMPSEKERPPRPEVAMPRTGRSCVRVTAPSSAWREDAGAQAVAGREMDRDVAAVVDIGLVERAAGQHRLQHLVGDGAGDGGHRRDEDGAMRPHGLGHAPRDRALQQRIGLADRPAQDRQLAHQRRQDVAEAIDGLAIGALDLVARAERLDDEVDRPVLQVQAAVGQRAARRSRPSSSSRTLWARSTSSSVTAREA